MTDRYLPKTTLVCVGSELLRGKLNTHAGHLARRLASIGLALHEETTVSDEVPEITAALRRALDRFDIILVSGGLGPTFDDLTREAASEATGRSLVLSPPLLKGIQAKFRRAHYKMPPTNARQAYLLEGAQAIANLVGTAPGQWLELASPPAPLPLGEGGRRPGETQVLILLPGPPRELYPMLEQFVLPKLKKLFPQRPQSEAHLHFVGVPESVVDHKVRPIIAREQKHDCDQVQFTILAHLGLVDFDVFVSSDTVARAKRKLQRIVSAIRQAIGKAWYGSDDAYPLEKVVGDHLRHQRATLAVAESCTGGLLASRLTEIPGSSDYFVEGRVTYANAAKMQQLGVPKELLKLHGAVSRPVAIAMAQGIRQRAQTTYGIGITGIAGPSGGTAKKPVGLVYISLSTPRGVNCQEYRFTGNRDAIRQRSVLAALDLLRHADLAKHR